ncbi:MAG: hypothetical protein Q9209_007574 [Squamulea sp. 1 TL-2023]
MADSWRLPFGQSGLLALFLRIQTIERVENGILVQALKFIGNTCADTDTNRELAISPEYLPSLIRRVENHKIAKTIVPVVYNICNDYERAQYAFRTNGLCPALIKLLENPQFEAPGLLTYIYSLLDVSSHQYDMTACPDRSVQTVVELLLGDGVELDDMLLILNTATAFLQFERFQQYFIEHDLVNTLLKAIDTSIPADRGLDGEVLSLQRAVTRILSDISAIGAFAKRHPIDSPLVHELIERLASPQQQLQICSCLILGNLARSDAVCRDMVNRLSLHDRLLEIMDDQETHPQALFAALGFLRNLALPAENKPIIGTQQSTKIISSFWSVDVNPQIQHASVALLRQLLNGCIGNVRWLLESLSPDPDSPAYEKTYLSLLLLLFGRTDDVATKFETGRTVATICRCISLSSQGLPPESTTAIWHRLYGMHPDIATPLAMMISQSRFPVLRSEGWFALALMARSGEGSAAVSEVFQQLEVFGVLVSTITGQSATSTERPTTAMTSVSDSSGNGNGSDRSPEQVQEMKVKDRENALVLGDNLSDIRRSVLEDLLRGPQSPEHAQELMTRAQSEERLE